MREKKFIGILTGLSVALMVCGTAFAQQGKIQSGPYQGRKVPMAAPQAVDAKPFYSNFVTDPCSGCNYSFDNGFPILGPSNCFRSGFTQSLAYPFIASKSGMTHGVELAITDWDICTPTSHRFTVDIYSDDCMNVPGASLGTGSGSAAAEPCGTARVPLHAQLTEGAKYWLVVTTDALDPSQASTTAIWWQTNTAWSDYNQGNGWIADAPGSPSAFAVQ
jgi:hypothetical protein